jgi:hypothetical protein
MRIAFQIWPRRSALDAASQLVDGIERYRPHLRIIDGWLGSATRLHRIAPLMKRSGRKCKLEHVRTLRLLERFVLAEVAQARRRNLAQRIRLLLQ